MTKYLISTVIAIIILWLGEKLPNQTKDKYIKDGYSWNKVIIYSNLAALVGGLTSTITIITTNMTGTLNPVFLPFATAITAYITVQSVMTDLKTLLINRNILRVAYVSMYIISVYNVTTNDLFKINMMALVTFTAALIFIFIFSSIGASDVRAIAVALPYVISVGGYIAIQMLIATLFVVAVVMFIKRQSSVKKELKTYRNKYPDMYKELGEKQFNRISRKTIRGEFNNSEEHAMPVGPFMIMPFLIFLIAYPVLV